MAASLTSSEVGKFVRKLPFSSIKSEWISLLLLEKINSRKMRFPSLIRLTRKYSFMGFDKYQSVPSLFDSCLINA
jgi:hypothetical protein